MYISSKPMIFFCMGTSNGVLIAGIDDVKILDLMLFKFENIYRNPSQCVGRYVAIPRF